MSKNIQNLDKIFSNLATNILKKTNENNYQPKRKINNTARKTNLKHVTKQML